jgi:transcriptional regulator with XRE-family HTH domain
MPTHKLENYLRMYRKRSGLTQRDVAFLLGCQNGAQVSRYEKRKRVPPLQTALACEAVFGVPVAELFAGMRESVEKEIRRRFVAIQARLLGKTAEVCKKGEARLTAQKLRWLAERGVPQPASQNSTP